VSALLREYLITPSWFSCFLRRVYLWLCMAGGSALCNHVSDFVVLFAATISLDSRKWMRLISASLYIGPPLQQKP
jgi:hypothetical protein